MATWRKDAGGGRAVRPADQRAGTRLQRPLGSPPGRAPVPAAPRPLPRTGPLDPARARPRTPPSPAGTPDRTRLAPPPRPAGARRLPLPLQLAAAAAIVFVVAEAGRAVREPGPCPRTGRRRRPLPSARVLAAPLQRQYSGEQALRGGGGGGGARSGRCGGPGRGGPRRRHGGAGTR